MKYLHCIVWIYLIVLVKSQNLSDSCYSPIYCYGDLLRTVQLARIYTDSKTFVDLKQIHPTPVTLRNFERLKSETGGNPTREQVREFVNENFEPGNELLNATLPDFNPRPPVVERIKNETVKNFTLDLIQIWPQLAKLIKNEVSEIPDQYSIIPVPNTFVIPGGRFREYYYWDSYWIIEGLLICEMKETARGMIDNFLSLVERYGFIPNGGRIYYLKRSQPPLLTPMAHLYFSKTRNTGWLRNSIDTLVRELKYWTNQTIKVEKNGVKYTLLHYNAPSLGPRPESYREDIETVSYYNDEDAQREVYIDLKSGAESGWDFSARWIFDEQGGNNANLSHIQTRRVIPVDLNAFMCGALRDISNLYFSLGNISQSVYWYKKHQKLRKAIDNVLWDPQDNIWYDYDVKLRQHRRKFYPSSVTPLWSKCFEPIKASKLATDVVNYLSKNEILKYLGGIPTSLDETGEQWDFPNAWPPLQDIVVRGLRNTKQKVAQDEAQLLAKRWVENNIIGYKHTGYMFEKYDAVTPGQYGGGGEYDVQSGFGWSNGVAFSFIDNYYANNV